MLELSAAGKPQEAYAVNKAQVLPHVSEAVEGVHGPLRRQGRARGDRAASDRGRGGVGPHSGRSLLLVSALVIGFAMAFWFSRRIQQTVEEILDRLQMLREHCTTDLAQRARGRRRR